MSLRSGEGFVGSVFEGRQSPLAASDAGQRSSVHGAGVSRRRHLLLVYDPSDDGAQAIGFENHERQMNDPVAVCLCFELGGKRAIGQIHCRGPHCILPKPIHAGLLTQDKFAQPEWRMNGASLSRHLKILGAA